MKAIQVRNVPPDVHAVLQARADAAGQSMQEYLLGLLAEHVSRPTVAEWLELAERNASGRGTFEETVEWIREERDGR